MSPGDRLLAATDPLANPTAMEGMDTPLKRPPAWQRYGPYGIAGSWSSWVVSGYLYLAPRTL
jgi:hypothetical protein